MLEFQLLALHNYCVSPRDYLGQGIQEWTKQKKLWLNRLNHFKLRLSSKNFARFILEYLDLSRVSWPDLGWSSLIHGDLHWSRVSLTYLSWQYLFVMLCAIWYHLYNFKNVKNTHGGVFTFLNCKIGAKPRQASHIEIPFKKKS